MQGLKQYDMDSAVAASEIGIHVSTRYLKDILGYTDVLNLENHHGFRGKDIDLLAVMDDAGGLRGTTIEVKTDRLTTGNLFFETVSNLQKGTPGCLMYSEADWLHYYFTGYKQLYVMGMLTFRKWVLRNRARYQVKMTSTGAGTERFYASEGIPIPLTDIREGFTEFSGKLVDVGKAGLM